MNFCIDVPTGTARESALHASQEQRGPHGMVRSDMKLWRYFFSNLNGVPPGLSDPGLKSWTSRVLTSTHYTSTHYTSTHTHPHTTHPHTSHAHITHPHTSHAHVHTSTHFTCTHTLMHTHTFTNQADSPSKSLLPFCWTD